MTAKQLQDSARELRERAEDYYIHALLHGARYFAMGGIFEIVNEKSEPVPAPPATLSRDDRREYSAAAAVVGATVHQGSLRVVDDFAYHSGLFDILKQADSPRTGLEAMEAILKGKGFGPGSASGSPLDRLGYRDKEGRLNLDRVRDALFVIPSACYEALRAFVASLHEDVRVRVLFPQNADPCPEIPEPWDLDEVPWFGNAARWEGYMRSQWVKLSFLASRTMETANLEGRDAEDTSVSPQEGRTGPALPLPGNTSERPMAAEPETHDSAARAAQYAAGILQCVLKTADLPEDGEVPQDRALDAAVTAYRVTVCVAAVRARLWLLSCYDPHEFVFRDGTRKVGYVISEAERSFRVQWGPGSVSRVRKDKLIEAKRRVLRAEVNDTGCAVLASLDGAAMRQWSGAIREHEKQGRVLWDSRPIKDALTVLDHPPGREWVQRAYALAHEAFKPFVADGILAAYPPEPGMPEGFASFADWLDDTVQRVDAWLAQLEAARARSSQSSAKEDEAGGEPKTGAAKPAGLGAEYQQTQAGAGATTTERPLRAWLPVCFLPEERAVDAAGIFRDRMLEAGRRRQPPPPDGGPLQAVVEAYRETLCRAIAWARLGLLSARDAAIWGAPLPGGSMSVEGFCAAMASLSPQAVWDAAAFMESVERDGTTLVDEDQIWNQGPPGAEDGKPFQWIVSPEGSERLRQWVEDAYGHVKVAWSSLVTSCPIGLPPHPPSPAPFRSFGAWARKMADKLDPWLVEIEACRIRLGPEQTRGVAAARLDGDGDQAASGDDATKSGAQLSRIGASHPYPAPLGSMNDEVPSEYRDEGRATGPPLTAEYIEGKYGKRYARPYDRKPGITSSTLRARAAEGRISFRRFRLPSKKGVRVVNVYAWDAVREIAKKLEKKRKSR